MEISCTPDENVFDDGDWELIDALVRVFSSMFHIKGHVSVLDDTQWKISQTYDMTPKEKKDTEKEIDSLFGQASTENNTIWLNPRILKRSYDQLVDTIVHELLHIRFPNESEKQIMDKERKLIGRFDTLRKQKWCYV